jgi:hypothetical protein
MHLSTLFTVASLTTVVLGKLATVAEVDIGKDKYKYLGLVGHATVPSDARDQFGDTLGGWGSAISADLSTWEQKRDGSYTGIVYAVPDRGWNTNGTMVRWLN